MNNSFYKMRDPEQKQGLEDMVAWINKIKPSNQMDMIEIGSYVGESTIIFANQFRYVVSVDPFINDYDPTDEACKFASFDLVYKEFIKNTFPYFNIKSIRETSRNAFDILRNWQWDLVYIDGSHTLDDVWFDIKNYKDIIKKGGFIAGHDYGWGNVRHNIGMLLDDEVHAVFQDGSWIKQII